MKILGVIPARLAATRFPDKPMALIEGMPMIGHCYFRSRMAQSLDMVCVATCDEEIKNYVEGIGGKAVMTSDRHERATDRTAEALEIIERELAQQFDIIVMIQGDEPLVNPAMIEEAVAPMLNGDVEVSNLMWRLADYEEALNPNNVKVVVDTAGNALYMSREAIPSAKKYKEPIPYYRQLGLIAFSRDALLRFPQLAPTQLEIIESVDMNRLLEHKVSIKMVATAFEADSVDTPEDLVRVSAKMKKDQLFSQYINVHAHKGL
jgi:3-deoxy-manno-octulosonate cytidylyltransferase (CMP-KDO synthetase)